MSALNRFLAFFRLIDDYDQRISLTNVAIIIVMYKLLSTEATSLNDVGLVFVALLNYSYKKYINKDVTSEDKENA